MQLRIEGRKVSRSGSQEGDTVLLSIPVSVIKTKQGRISKQDYLLLTNKTEKDGKGKGERMEKEWERWRQTITTPGSFFSKEGGRHSWAAEDGVLLMFLQLVKSWVMFPQLVMVPVMFLS